MSLEADRRRIDTALNTLEEICKKTPAELENDRYFDQRQAAEEILRHYREERMVKEMVFTLNVNGAVPVRPMTRSELKEEGT